MRESLPYIQWTNLVIASARNMKLHLRQLRKSTLATACTKCSGRAQYRNVSFSALRWETVQGMMQ